MATPIKYHQALADGTRFHNAIHALSLLHFHAKPGKDNISYLSANPTTRKHVNLLEGLALLLVSKEKTDVAATGLLMQPEGIKVFWAKNSNTVATPAEQEYLTGLIARFKQGKKTEDILDHIIPFCHRKIVGRCRKLASLFKISPSDSNVFNLREDKHDYCSTESNLKGKAFISPGRTLQDSLDQFIRDVGEVTFTTSPEALAPLLDLAFAVTYLRPTIKDLVDRAQWNRLRKLGDYRSCCSKVSQELAKLPSGIRENISTIQVCLTYHLRSKDQHA